MNNFMDGISIGAGYSYQLSTGIKLSTAIAFEEYTHKLGKLHHCCHTILDLMQEHVGFEQRDICL